MWWESFVWSHKLDRLVNFQHHARAKCFWHETCNFTHAQRPLSPETFVPTRGAASLTAEGGRVRKSVSAPHSTSFWIRLQVPIALYPLASKANKLAKKLTTTCPSNKGAFSLSTYSDPKPDSIHPSLLHAPFFLNSTFGQKNTTCGSQSAFALPGFSKDGEKLRLQLQIIATSLLSVRKWTLLVHGCLKANAHVCACCPCFLGDRAIHVTVRHGTSPGNAREN